jgi:hypothetical protein
MPHHIANTWLMATCRTAWYTDRAHNKHVLTGLEATCRQGGVLTPSFHPPKRPCPGRKAFFYSLNGTNRVVQQPAARPLRTASRNAALWAPGTSSGYRNLMSSPSCTVWDNVSVGGSSGNPAVRRTPPESTDSLACSSQPGQLAASRMSDCVFPKQLFSGLALPFLCWRASTER